MKTIFIVLEHDTNYLIYVDTWTGGELKMDLRKSRKDNDWTLMVYNDKWHEKDLEEDIKKLGLLDFNKMQIVLQLMRRSFKMKRVTGLKISTTRMHNILHELEEMIQDFLGRTIGGAF